MILLDGKKTAEDLKSQIAGEVAELKKKGGKTPHLAAILVGNDGASETYVGSKVKSCEQVGFDSSLFRFNSDVSEAELLKKIQEVNDNPAIDGLIVQLPLPKHISVDKVVQSIKPEKDVDGFHPVNIGRMNKGIPAHIAATPNGIRMLLKKYQIHTKGMNCVIIGRSHIVGSPMSILLTADDDPGNCTVTVCHRYTKNLADFTKMADMIIVATGKPGLLTGDMVKEGAVVIDVGTTRVPDTTKKSGFTLKGDVDFDSVAPKCSYITPVPGGVGPMTIVSLLQNTLNAAKGEIFSRK